MKPRQETLDEQIDEPEQDSPQTSDYLDAEDGSQNYSERYESLDEELPQDDQLEEDGYNPDEYLPEDQDDEYDPDEDDEQHIPEEEEDYSDQEADEQDSDYERFDIAEYEQDYVPIEAEEYLEEGDEIVDTTTNQTLDNSQILELSSEHEPIDEYSQEDPDESNTEESSEEGHFTEYDPRGGLFLDEIPRWQEEENDYIVEEPQDGDTEGRITTIQPQNRSIATQSQQLTQLMANLPNQHEETYQDNRVQARMKATRYSTRGGTIHATLESEYRLCTITIKEEPTEQFNLPECTITLIRRKIAINGTYINKNNKRPRKEVEILKSGTKVDKHTTKDEDNHMETAIRTMEPIPTEEDPSNLKQKEKVRLVDKNKQKHETVLNETYTLKKSEVDALNVTNIAKGEQNHAKTTLQINQVHANAPQDKFFTRNEPSSTTIQEQVQSISNNIQNLQDQLQNLIDKAKI
ncbi:probable serine/threonine-protein kinase kinX [Solenopsis invicta]|uniref:probable serine/threonine-protein kinase kinX n=1 Tax=Solenopsis invicta TaxID=13686 RepID=UPI00193D6EBC|nr:probable serine/threonine-protein kinase kinX [Solenopsis invicta]